MKTTRLLLLVMILALVLSFGLAGCKPADPEVPAEPDVEEPADDGDDADDADDGDDAEEPEEPAEPEPMELDAYELTWLFLGNTHDERVIPVQDAVNALLTEKINATLDIQMIGWGDHKQKVNTLIGSGEKVDLCFTAKWWSYQEWVSLGYFNELNDLMKEYAPETIKVLGEDVFVAGSAINGVNYAVPTLKETCVPEGWVFNNEYLLKYDFDKTTIKSDTDLIPMLETIRDNEPDVIPYNFEGRWATVPFQGIISQVHAYNDNSKTTLVNRWATPEMEEHLIEMKLFNESGFFHPDVSTENFEQDDYLSTGMFFVNPQPVKGENVKADELQAMNPGSDYVDQEADDARWVTTTHMGGSMQAIPVTSQDPARAMMFLELFHTDAEIINLLAFGIEGVNYTLTDQTAEAAPGVIELTEGNSLQGMLAQWMLGNVYLQYITTGEDITKNVKLKEVSDTAAVHFTTGFYFDPTMVSAQIAAVDNTTGEYERALLTGGMPGSVEDNLAALNEKLIASGIEEVLAECQKQLDEWMANK